MKNWRKKLKKFFHICSNFSIKAVLASIHLYQHTCSPDHSVCGKLFFGFARCRFYPSCSEYTVQAISQYGLLEGSMFSFKRLARCHPFCDGGYDPVRGRENN